MSKGSISLSPDLLDTAAGNATAVGDTFGQARRSVKGISLHGLEPATRGRTEGVIQRASALAGQAETTAEAQAPKLRRRARLARAADAALSFTLGGIKFTVDFLKPGDGYDVAGVLDATRTQMRKHMTETIKNDRYARRRLARATELYNRSEERWRTKRWDSPEAMRRELRRPNSPYNKTLKRLKTWEKRTRKLDLPENLIKRLPSGVQNAPVVKPILKHVPILGTAITYAGNESKMKTPDAIGKTTAQTIGSTAGGAAGAAACGTAAAATLGLGSLTCPVLIFGGSYLGDKIGGAVYEPGKKAVGWVGKQGDKVIKAIPDLNPF